MTVTDVPADEFRVCVLSVDTPHGFGAGLERVYHSFKSPALAELFAGKFAQQMEDEGYATYMRAVFVEKDGAWKTIGSYFDKR